MSDVNFPETYMGTALLLARHSKAKRRQVGAVLVTKQGVMLSGYNGTPKGTCNVCENEKIDMETGEIELVTKPEVIHAELNCILKAAKEGVSCVDSVIYVTLSPCMPCAAMLIQAGVREVYYHEPYRDLTPVDYLMHNGVIVKQI